MKIFIYGVKETATSMAFWLEKIKTEDDSEVEEENTQAVWRHHFTLPLLLVLQSEQQQDSESRNDSIQHISITLQIG